MLVARRQFLRGKSSKTPLLPPWLREPDKFYDLCSRCDACIGSCPEGVLQRGSGGFPEVNFGSAECTFCQQCTTVCPEQLFELSKPAWEYHAAIGSSCLVNAGVMCRSCEESCEPRAIVFRYERSRIAQPVIDQTACTGCGACVSSCPSQAITVA